MKLTPEQQEIRATNQATNLKNQIGAMFKRTNEGSFETRRRYQAAGDRFCDFLGETTNLKNFRNVQVRHIKAYIEHLQSEDHLPTYLLTEVSGIKWIHRRMNPKRNLPDSNRCFGIDKRELYKFDKSIMVSEFDSGVKYALAKGRMDVVLEFFMDRYFGLRHEEFVTLRVHQIEKAIEYRQLHLKNTKGGQERDVPVSTDMQLKILKRVLVYTKKENKQSMDYVICDNHRNSVVQKKKSLQNWMNNNKDAFLNPNRTDEKRPGKKPRDKTIHWHSLRHLYYQETKERLKAEGRLTPTQIEKELAEAMGHHRISVNNYYSSDLDRV